MIDAHLYPAALKHKHKVLIQHWGICDIDTEWVPEGCWHSWDSLTFYAFLEFVERYMIQSVLLVLCWQKKWTQLVHQYIIFLYIKAQAVRMQRTGISHQCVLYTWLVNWGLKCEPFLPPLPQTPPVHSTSLVPLLWNACKVYEWILP